MFGTYSFDKGKPDPFEYLPAKAETFVLGEALKLDSGKLTKCTGTTKPEYIAMEDKVVATAGEALACIRVNADTCYETELSEASASIAIGAKYTIDTTGTKITATATSGVAEVISYDGTAAGSKVRVRF